MMARWQFWIDRGGTFTDIVGAPSRRRHRHAQAALGEPRPLSATPRSRASASCWACAAGAPIPVEKIDAVKMGTTVATNALLERKGEATVLFITRGFRDQLRIAYQNRPRIFDRHIVLPELLYRKVIEIDERVGAHGEIVTPLDEAQVERELAAASRRRLPLDRDRLHARLPLLRRTSPAWPSSRATPDSTRFPCRTRCRRS